PARRRTRRRVRSSTSAAATKAWVASPARGGAFARRKRLLTSRAARISRPRRAGERRHSLRGSSGFRSWFPKRVAHPASSLRGTMARWLRASGASTFRSTLVNTRLPRKLRAEARGERRSTFGKRTARWRSLRLLVFLLHPRRPSVLQRSHDDRRGGHRPEPS